MEKTYKLNGCVLLVHFERKLVRIMSPDALLSYLSNNIEQRSKVLAKHIKSDYFANMGIELAISDDSLIIEIWGHVYAGYLARAMKRTIRLAMLHQAANFVIERSDCIDCGERAVDANRFVWDFLANFKSIILRLLPKRIRVPLK